VRAITSKVCGTPTAAIADKLSSAAIGASFTGVTTIVMTESLNSGLAAVALVGVPTPLSVPRTVRTTFPKKLLAGENTKVLF
jgi:hypothetical protein